jgi:hypothetical protein
MGVSLLFIVWVIRKCPTLCYFYFCFTNLFFSTGFGQHADYLFGWKGDALQRAMDARCNIDFPGDCPLLVQPDAPAMACTQAPIVQEQVDGWLTKLPGNNPITP